MLLNSQKYWTVSYAYSDDILNYSKSIDNFLIKLLDTFPKEFLIKDINQDNCASCLLDDLLKLIQQKIDKLIINNVFNKKEYLFFYKDKKQIFYLKKGLKECDFIKWLNNCIMPSFQAEIQDAILSFFKNYANGKIIDILKSFLASQVNIGKLIKIDNNCICIDFLSVPLDSPKIKKNKIFYTENKFDLTDKHVANLNKTFNIAVNFKDITISEVEYDKKVIGLIIDKFLFFYGIYPLFEKLTVITPQLKYDYLKNCILNDSKEYPISNNIGDFKKCISNDKLLKALCCLKENIYITEDLSDCIDSTIDNFFGSGYMIETNYLEHNQFFIPEPTYNCEFLFGVNCSNNARDHKGRGEKGLKTWINADNKELNNAAKNTQTKSKTKAIKVKHLLPELAYYFGEKFFEDFLENLLKEIQGEKGSLILDIISNKVFLFNKNKNITDPLSSDTERNDQQEFDFIINYKKSDNSTSTLVIEAKTKLSKHIVLDQAEKVEKYIEADDLKFFEDYCLLGFKKDEDVNLSMSYFINNMSINNTSDLAFKYPLPTTKEKNLYCIASTNRATLKCNLLYLFEHLSNK